jgi:hypothetical protein
MKAQSKLFAVEHGRRLPLAWFDHRQALSTEDWKDNRGLVFVMNAKSFSSCIGRTGIAGRCFAMMYYRTKLPGFKTRSCVCPNLP